MLFFNIRMAYLRLRFVNNRTCLYCIMNQTAAMDNNELNCFFLKAARHIRCYHKEAQPRASNVLSLGPARGQRNFSLKIREWVSGKETWRKTLRPLGCFALRMLKLMFLSVCVCVHVCIACDKVGTVAGKHGMLNIVKVV